MKTKTPTTISSTIVDKISIATEPFEKLMNSEFRESLTSSLFCYTLATVRPIPTLSLSDFNIPILEFQYAISQCKAGGPVRDQDYGALA